MVLSAALDNGFVFMALVAILTSVIGAVYYLNVIKQIFFFQHDYMLNPDLKALDLTGQIDTDPSLNFKTENIVLSSGITTSISILSLILLLFIYIPNEWFNMANILTLILFKP